MLYENLPLPSCYRKGKGILCWIRTILYPLVIHHKGKGILCCMRTYLYPLVIHGKGKGILCCMRTYLYPLVIHGKGKGLLCCMRTYLYPIVIHRKGKWILCCTRTYLYPLPSINYDLKGAFGRRDQGSKPHPLFRSLGKLVHPTLPVFFGRDSKPMPGEVKDPMHGNGKNL